MILSDSERQNRIFSNDIVISPMPADDALQPTSVDLHLAPTIKLFDKWDVIEVGKVPEMKSLEMGERLGYQLRENQFVLASTVERIEVPYDLVAVVDGKSSLGRIGLAVHITAGYIDPGFKGNITLELKNMNPNMMILLRPGMSICQLRFHSILGRVMRPYGSKGLGSKYQYSVGTVAARPVDS